MEKLLEQAQLLVANLNKAIAEVESERAALKKQGDAQAAVQVTLDNFQADLLQREANIVPIENIGAAQAAAAQSKAEADLEWTKIRAEWDKLDHEKARFVEERRLGRLEIADKKELYDRGAQENKDAKAKLDERAAKLKAATQGV